MGTRKFSVNNNYFSKLDTQEQAYILGLMYSDGNIHKNSNYESYIVTFGQSEERKDIVYRVAQALSPNCQIYRVLRGSKLFYYFNINSKIMFDDLSSLGLFPNKSLTISFPTFIPDELMPHFIRGLFDGDGCIWNGKRKIMKVKDPSRSNGFRDRVVHNVKFTYTGNENFVNSLQDYLIGKLGFKKTKLNRSKSKSKSCSENICTMEYSGRGQARKFYEYIYNDASIYCETKKLKFEEIFCASEEKSSEDTTLIAGTPETVISSQASDNISVEGSSTIPEMGVESSDSKCVAPNEQSRG